MKEIPLPELPNHKNEKIFMKDINTGMTSVVVIKKVLGELVSGFNVSNHSIFEILDSKSVKFYGK